MAYHGTLHGVPEHAGRVRDGLCVLRDGPDGFHAAPAPGRNRRASAPRPARAARRGSARLAQSRAHGHGRAAAQLRQRDDRAGHPHRRRAASTSARRASRSARSAWCRASCGWPKNGGRINLAVSLHGASEAGTRRARAREPPLAAGRTDRRLPHLRRENRPPHFLRVDAHRRGERFAGAQPRGWPDSCSRAGRARQSHPAQPNRRVSPATRRAASAADAFQAVLQDAGFPVHGPPAPRHRCRRRAAASCVRSGARRNWRCP